jgi:carbamoyl-phosphate synthase large subunit
MKNKRVFISGGAGVIGQQMVPKLVALGAIVYVGDLKPRPAAFAGQVVYRQGDLNELTVNELAAFAPEVFIHLAATFERSAESLAFWQDNFRHNVSLSHHLMSLMMQITTLRRVVFASSYLIYDPVLYQFAAPSRSPVSLKETDPVRPRNLTGMAKLSHEMELQFVDGFFASRFSSALVRIFRGYGCNSRDVISRWIRLLLKEQPIRVYQPEGIFDYIYAADTAEGLIRVAQDKDITGIINLGTGRARRVQDVVEILKRHFPNIQQLNEEVAQPYEASQADLQAFNERTGWRPEYDLERAIPEMIAFERAQQQIECVAPSRPPRVLVTSAARKIPLIRAVQSAARRIHPEASVIAGDIDPHAVSGLVADEFWLMPRLARESVQSVIQACLLRRITDILPTRDGELAFWAESAAEFSLAGITVFISETNSLTRCLDKLAFSSFGLEHGLPFIPAASSIDQLAAEHWVVKERYGAGSRMLGINLDLPSALAHAKTLDAPIYQPFIAGQEISIDAWMSRDGLVKGLVLRRRDTVVNGESQVTTTFRDQALEDTLILVLESLKLCGPVVMQAIIDANNKPHVIECNARFGGASTAAIAAGLDSLYWSLLEARGENVEEYAFTRAAHDIRQIRVACDLHIACDKATHIDSSGRGR